MHAGQTRQHGYELVTNLNEVILVGDKSTWSSSYNSAAYAVLVVGRRAPMPTRKAVRGYEVGEAHRPFYNEHNVRH